MIKNLQADYFFDLSEFQHAALFQKGTFVWEALAQMADYIKNFPLGKIEIKNPAGAFLIDPPLISIGKGTIVEPGAYIKGPCIIGENCTIRHGAYIRGNVIVGDRCVLGHDTEAKNALLLNDVHAAHFAYLGDTILGNKVNLGAGTKCANLKLTAGSVIICFEGKKIDTGLRKLGAIMGDNTQTGCNSVTNPGTLLGQNVLCYPCINFGGFVPSHSIVKTNIHIEVTTRQKKS